MAQAQAGQAKAQLDQLLAGPRAEDIGVAEAQVRQSQTALGGARIALEKTILDAPLIGTVGKVMVEEGETVMAGAPVVVIGDLRALQVEAVPIVGFSLTKSLFVAYEEGHLSTRLRQEFLVFAREWAHSQATRVTWQIGEASEPEWQNLLYGWIRIGFAGIALLFVNRTLTDTHSIRPHRRPRP